MSEPRPVTLGVVLASAGRPELLARALRSCAEQEGQPFVGVVSVPDDRSLPDPAQIPSGWIVVRGTRGLAAQRNAGMRAIPDVDLIAFFDDDAVLRADYLSNATTFLRQNPTVLGLTGRVLADGASTAEIAQDEAERLVAASAQEATTGRWRPTRELYGCNFVVRASGASRLLFDERLPLYSWLEDHDYARRLLRRGGLAKVDDCVIVHRGAASGGRQAHARLGYSQVMNPVYLWTKGSFPSWLAVEQIFRPLAKNVALSLAGRARKLRRDRLRGNVLAFGDVVTGRIRPERAAQL